jgi:uncharacterized lipoprotein
MRMLSQVKTFTLLLLLSLLSGCGAAIRHLDSTWTDDKTVYNKSQPLEPLEIPPELSENSPVPPRYPPPVSPPSRENTLESKDVSNRINREKIEVKGEPIL